MRQRRPHTQSSNIQFTQPHPLHLLLLPILEPALSIPAIVTPISLTPLISSPCNSLPILVDYSPPVSMHRFTCTICTPADSRPLSTAETMIRRIAHSRDISQVFIAFRSKLEVTTSSCRRAMTERVVYGMCEREISHNSSAVSLTHSTASTAPLSIPTHS